MADTLCQSSGAQALKLLDGRVPGYFERPDLSRGSQTGSAGQTRSYLTRASAPSSAGSTFQGPKTSSNQSQGAEADGPGLTPAGQKRQERQSVRMDSAGEMAGTTPGMHGLGNYARKLALTQAKAGLLPLPMPKQQVDLDHGDVRSMRPSGLMARHSDSVTVPGSSIRRASAAPNNAVAGTPPRPSIRRASAAPSVGSAPRPSISRRSVVSGSTLVGRPSVSRMSGLGGQRPVSMAEAAEAPAEGERPRLRWRRNLDSAGNAPQEAPKADVDGDRAALMRRIAALAVAEDEAVLQQMQGQPGVQKDTQGMVAVPEPEHLQPSLVRASQTSVRSDSASSREEGSVQQLEMYQQGPEDGTGQQRTLVDWQPVLAAMALSYKQKRAAHEARLALDASLAGLHVQRAALYETLCSFATTDADDGLEDAISETKQELVRNEAAEAEELRAFRYTFRSVLAGPLLSARSIIKIVCPGASPDFLALADAIKADLQQCGDAHGGDAPVVPAPMRRRSRAATVNPDAIPEGAEEEE